MGLVLIIVSILMVALFVFSLVHKKHLRQYKSVQIIAGFVASVGCAALIFYYIPFSIALPHNPKYQVQTSDALIWIDENDEDRITDLLRSLKLQRETFPTNQILPTDQVTNEPIRENEWVAILVYDADTQSYGLPERIGTYYFIIPYPTVCRYISFDNSPLTNYRILMTDVQSEQIAMILNDYTI